MPEKPKKLRVKRIRKKRNPVLEVKKVLQAEAAEIKASYEKAKIIHGTIDIDSAGSEIETTVRNILRRRLPAAYKVSQGHIIDTAWNSSGQFDIIIADNLYFPTLFKTLDETEYFTHESVYAIGEVKATFKGGKQITEFIDKSEFVKKLRKEHQTPQNYLNHNTRVAGSLSMQSAWPYRNPLFTFMFFVDSGDFAHNKDKLAQILQDFCLLRKKENLPNVLCFLDLGIVCYQLFENAGKAVSKFGDLQPIPEFTKESYPNLAGYWTFFRYGENPYEEAGNLSIFYSLLFNAISRSVLSNPDYFKYVQKVARPDATKQVEGIVFPKSRAQGAELMLRVQESMDGATQKLKALAVRKAEALINSSMGAEITAVHDQLIEKFNYSTQKAMESIGGAILILEYNLDDQKKSPTPADLLSVIKKLLET